MTFHGYELFYSDGGHGGPYWTLEHAVQDARRRIAGCVHTNYVEVRDRDLDAVGGYGPVALTIRRVDDDPQPNQMLG